jgi:hypothetical protein
MNFLDAYKLFSSGNEAPEIFHKWSAISALSSFISRRVWIDQGHFIIHPNLYIILVGDPAGGKSTAMNIARRVVRSVKGIAIAPSAITLQALTELMGDDNGPCKKGFVHKVNGVETREQYSHITIFANELVTLLGAEPMGMINFFTDVWDNPVFENKTKNKGHDIINGPFVTMLACMTPEVTGQMLKQAIITGGFSRRCLFVFSSQRGKPVPRPTMTMEQMEALSYLIKRGTEMQSIRGKFEWTPEAQEWFDAWYKTNYDKMASVLDAATMFYYRAKDGMLLKLAMLISLARTNELILRVEDMEKALDMLNDTENSLSKVFLGAGANKQADIAGKIMSFLQTRKTPVLEKQVYTTMFQHGTRADINECLNHLVNIGEIKKFTEKLGEHIVVKVQAVDSTV